MKYILFGASELGRKNLKIVESFNEKVIGFLDNDIKKWGKEVSNIKIMSIDNLQKSNDFKIIISSMYVEEIEKQLIEFGYIYGEYIFIDDYIDRKLLDFKLEVLGVNLDDTISNIFCLPDGMRMNGVVKWSKEMVDCTENSKLMCMNYDYKIESYQMFITKIAKKILNSLPCNIITNDSFDIYCILKVIPEEMKKYINVISTIHNDKYYTYKINEKYENYIDKIFCVSEDIKNKMSILTNKEVLFKNNSIMINTLQRQENKIINIGFAGRLIKRKKRADLIVQLIRNLDKKGIEFNFNIAGEGDLEEEILEYIMKNNLRNIVLNGVIPFEQMNKFWGENDISIIFSDSEGLSLALLESMERGCVPIVTNIPSHKNIIQDDYNGFLYEVGGVESLTNLIVKLDSDRKLLKEISKNTREYIVNNHNLDDYLDYFKREVLKYDFE